VEPGAEALAQRFEWLHALAPQHAASGGAAPELTTVFQSMADLGAELEGGGPGQGLPAYEAAVRRLRMDPAVRDRLFEMPATRGGEVAAAAAAGAAAAAAAADLDSRWADAYRFFRDNLAGRYPFDRTSSEDARLDDVETFFHPQSGLVAPFLEGAAAGTFNGPANSALARAGAIGAALFAGGSMGLAFDFQPDQPTNTGGPPVSEYSLTMLGQTRVYDMGALRPSLAVEWPGRSGAELVVLTRSGELRLAVEGDWAVMRMLDRATVRPVPNASREYDVSWPLQGNGFVVRAEYLLTTQAAAELVRSPGSFFSLRLPPRLSR
jgi:type VI secretion system protein ImpL